jgi:Phage tail tube protein
VCRIVRLDPASPAVPYWQTPVILARTVPSTRPPQAPAIAQKMHNCAIALRSSGQGGSSSGLVSFVSQGLMEASPARYPSRVDPPTPLGEVCRRRRAGRADVLLDARPRHDVLAPLVAAIVVAEPGAVAPGQAPRADGRPLLDLPGDPLHDRLEDRVGLGHAGLAKGPSPATSAGAAWPLAVASRWRWRLEKIETIRDDGLIEGADPTIAALTGRIDVRFADTTLIDLAADGTPVDLEFAYTLSAQAKLVLTAHEIYLPKPKLPVEGPGGVQASFDFRGAKNDVAGRMLAVTLTNDLDGIVYG